MVEVKKIELKKIELKPLFSNVGFLLIWLGQIASQLADRIFVYAFMVVAYKLTRTNVVASLPLLAFGIPSVLIAPWAGVLVDRFDRKLILVGSDVIRGILLILLMLYGPRSISLMFFIALLVYSAAQFFGPAESSSIPELVPKSDLILANSLFMITWMVASVVGFGLGSPLAHLIDIDGIFILAAVLYLGSAFFECFIPIKPHPSKLARSHILTDMLTGFEFIRRNTVVRYSLLKLFVATIAIASLSLLSISYASEILKIGEKNFGYLIIAVGLGMALGMFTLEKLRHSFRLGTIVVGSLLASGVVLFCLTLVRDVRLAFLLIILLGAGNIYITSTIQTILQHRIPRQIRGRVFGVQNMLVNSAFTLPVIFFGLLADLWGILTAIMLLALLVFATGMAGIFLPKFKTA